MTVTATGSGAPAPKALVTASHTSHDERSGAAAVRSDGAPGMPTIGPRGRVSISLRRTRTGLSGDPAMSRAEARFKAGYRVSPTRTYNAPVDWSAMMVDSPTEPAGRRNDQNSAPKQITAVSVIDARIAIDCRRPGSDSIRTRRSVRPSAARRELNWCAVTCTRVA